jgi:hypothetical protein
LQIGFCGFFYPQARLRCGIIHRLEKRLAIIPEIYSITINYREILMKVSVVDLRYKMNEVIRALGKREKVTILHRGKVKGIILPAGTDISNKVEDHPFFDMVGKEEKSVTEQMQKLRGFRYDAV